MKDIFNGVEGRLKVEDITNNKVLFEDKNLIVNGAGYILSQFIANMNVEGIKYIAVGDMNMTDSDSDVRPPSCNDYKLDNEVYRKEVDIETFEDNFGYGINFSIILQKNECNGESGRQLITEYGLLSSSIYQNTGNDDKDGRNILFSRKTKSPIYKDYEISLKITWTIYFKKNC